jgi:RNA polymerase sigma-70 factor (sigma-E family)
MDGSHQKIDLSGFVTARGPALVRFAHALCGDRHLAEDLVQDALSKVLRKYGRSLPLDNPEAYLRTVIARELLQWRRRRRVATVPFLEGLEPTERLPGGPDVPDAVWAALSTLPPRQRAVVVLGFYEDQDDDQIAAMIGSPVATVRSHRFRALKNLREQLARQGVTAPSDREVTHGLLHPPGRNT